jgi:hypothetical protein
METRKEVLLALESETNLMLAHVAPFPRMLTEIAWEIVRAKPELQSAL